MGSLDTPKRSDHQKHIVFIHLDLGIGGAEQLIVNLASASIGPSTPGFVDGPDGITSSPGMDARVTIYTTHCSPTHCFDVVKPPHGILANSVRIRGASIPVNVPLFVLFGPRIGTALCSTLRIVYLTYCAAKECRDADVFVVDVLPTGLPFLVCRWMAKSALFYCHFPDKLLTRDTVNGVAIDQEHQSQSGSTIFSILLVVKGILRLLKAAYRRVLDDVEEKTMQYADLIAVNSNFTKTEVLAAFPALKCPTVSSELACGDNDEEYLQILYPPIDLNKFIKPDFNAKIQNIKSGKVGPIFSLNRFERKKNVNVLLKAYALLRENVSNTSVAVPPLVVAGGYDPRNAENVEHLKELQELARELAISDYTTFKPSIGDDERAEALKCALCVVYTPHREHFGIVPLEAMYAGSPVVAVNSGGPKETVVDGETGFLVDNTVKAFASALETMVNNPEIAVHMGRKGHKRVGMKFGLDVFRSKWADIVEETIRRGEGRRRNWNEGRCLGSKKIFPNWAVVLAQSSLVVFVAICSALVVKLRCIHEPSLE